MFLTVRLNWPFIPGMPSLQKKIKFIWIVYQTQYSILLTVWHHWDHGSAWLPGAFLKTYNFFVSVSITPHPQYFTTISTFIHFQHHHSTIWKCQGHTHTSNEKTENDKLRSREMAKELTWFRSTFSSYPWFGWCWHQVTHSRLLEFYSVWNYSTFSKSKDCNIASN